MMGERMKGDFLVILGMFLYSFSFSVEMFVYSLYNFEKTNMNKKMKPQRDIDTCMHACMHTHRGVVSNW